MSRGKISLVAKPVGAQRVLRRFITASAALKRQLLDAEKELGRKAEVIFGAHAPFRTGRLIRGISSFTLGNGVTVKAEARNPQSGYDYVGVTRFGHGKIVPRHDRGTAFVLATKKRRATKRTNARPALRFTIGGRVVYAAYVNAWKPAQDWADAAMPEVEAAAQGVAARLGRTIEARF
jgi:hypothetical protein